jgi:hypothetical protein
MLNKLITIFITLLIVLMYNSSSAQQQAVFIENVGQVKDQQGCTRNDIQFSIADGGATAFISNEGISYQFTDGKTFCRVDAKLIGAQLQRTTVEKTAEPYFENYYHNSKLLGTAKSYSRIVYKEVYPGIDWVLKNGQKNGFEYEFIVHEGADASKIKIEYFGASDIQLINGNVQLTTALGTITEQAPQTYTHDGKALASHYLINKNKLRFYTKNPKNALVLDPKVSWCTYYGDTATASITYPIHTRLNKIKISNTKHLYAGGYTNGLDNIATTGAYMTTRPAGGPTFISLYYVKMDTLGRRLYATYYGSEEINSYSDLALDGDSVFVTGSDKSNLMATPGADLMSFHPYTYGTFLMKFNDMGLLEWCTYVGGCDQKGVGAQLFTDNNHNIYAFGSTYKSSGLYATPGSHQPSIADSTDAFLVKFNASTGKRAWGTYYGGSRHDAFTGLTCTEEDNSVALYLIGVSLSDTGITTPGAYMAMRPGALSGFFMVKFDTTGKRRWGTFLGGNSYESPLGITKDKKNNMYVTGSTGSTTGLATTGAYQTALGGNTDAFLMKVNTSGIPAWCTYFGGPEFDGANSVCTDTTGNIYICGSTSSYTGISDTAAFRQSYTGGFHDIMIAGFREDGSKLWGTYYGGIGYDVAYDICSDGTNLYVCGESSSDTGVATKGAFIDTNKLHRYLGFILKVSDAHKGLPIPVSLSELNNSRTFEIYPNPAEAFTMVAASGFEAFSNAEIHLISVTGSVIKTIHTKTNHVGELQQQIDLSPYSSGVYYVKIVTPTGSQTLQLSKL